MKLKVSVVELCVCLFLMLFSLAPLCLAVDACMHWHFELMYWVSL